MKSISMGLGVILIMAILIGLILGCTTAPPKHVCMYGPKPEESMTANIGGSMVFKCDIESWEKWVQRKHGDIVLFKEHYSKLFEMRLVYLGLSGDSIRIGYRELIDDYARPAFSEELTIPKKESTLNLKGITLTILSILPDGRITYKISPVENCEYNPYRKKVVIGGD